MNLNELHSFKLSDAIKFHKELNPKLWKNDQLDPLVKKQLLVIAEDFVEELGIDDLDVVDITISGSNAAFTWTKHSDLDLHILVNMSELHQDAVYRELFRAKKTLYNDTHDITVHGIPVELYVQDSAEPVVSLGEYSILHDKWIKIPKRRSANLDQNAAKAKFDQLKDLIDVALKTKHSKKINKALALIRRYRQAGLDKGGEFSPENLAYKAVRSQGAMDALYAMRDKLHSKELTIEEGYAGAKMKFLKPGELRGSHTPAKLMSLGFKKSQNGSWFILQSKWDELRKTGQLYEATSRKMMYMCEGAYYSKDMLLEQHLYENFMDSAKQYLGAKYNQKISDVKGQVQDFVNAGIVIKDILSNEQLLTNSTSQIRKWTRGMVQNIASNITTIGEKLNNPRLAKVITDAWKYIYNEVNKFIAMPGWKGFLGSLGIYGFIKYLNEMINKGGSILTNALSSGIIGSLVDQIKTLDVKILSDIKMPDFFGVFDKLAAVKTYLLDVLNQVKAKFGSIRVAGTAQFSQGIQLEEGELLAERLRKEFEDYDPNGKPPGPEFKPTMPAGTVKVDVSDVYDWYKLGQHISNMKGLGKHDFGKGPPSTILSFGDEDTEHKYIKDLEKTGLTTTDIDPVDVNQPKGMKRQKTDPTYNVGSSTEDLDEALDSQPYPYEESVDQEGNYLSTFFTDDNNEYVVKIEKGQGPWIDIVFYVTETRDDGVEYRSAKITGTGDARKVFATVIDVVKKYTDKHKPKAIHFSAQEPSRIRLYDAFIKRIDRALPDYVETKKLPNMDFWFVLKRKTENLDESKNDTISYSDAEKLFDKHLTASHDAYDRKDQAADTAHGDFAEELATQLLKNEGAPTIQLKSVLSRSARLFDKYPIPTTWEPLDEVIHPDSAYTFKQIPSTHWSTERRSEYVFTTEDKLLYSVTIDNLPGNRSRIAFSATKQDQPFPKFGVTGSGDAFKVLATVVEIIKKYVDEHHPATIFFSAKEPSRVKLYDSILKKLDRALPDYELTSKGPGYEAGTTYYYLKLKNQTLDEALDSQPYPYEQVENSRIQAKYTFNTDRGLTYFVGIGRGSDEKIIHISFWLHQPEQRGLNRMNMEIANTGDARKVFATVIDIVKKYVNEHKPNRIIFTASEDSRIRLYDAFVKRLDRELPGYISTPKVQGMSAWFILERKPAEDLDEATERDVAGDMLKAEWDRFKGGVKDKVSGIFKENYDIEDPDENTNWWENPRQWHPGDLSYDDLVRMTSGTTPGQTPLMTPLKVKIDEWDDQPKGTYDIKEFRKVSFGVAKLVIVDNGQQLTTGIMLDDPDTHLDRNNNRRENLEFYHGKYKIPAVEAFNLFQLQQHTASPKPPVPKIPQIATKWEPLDEDFEWQDDPMNWHGNDKDPTLYQGLLRKRVKMSLPEVYPEGHKYFIQVFYKNSPTTAVLVYTRNSSDVGRMRREIDFDAHTRGEVPEIFWWGDMTLTAEEAFNLYQLQKRNWNGKIAWKSADKQKTKWEPLDEALDSQPYPYQITSDTTTKQTSEFTTDADNRYVVGIFRYNDLPDDGSIFVDFSLENVGQYVDMGITGTGDSRKVFATVIEIIKKYVADNKPKHIYFTAGEPSRRRLYAALVKRVDRALPNYESKPCPQQPHLFDLVLKSEKIDEALDSQPYPYEIEEDSIAWQISNFMTSDRNRYKVFLSKHSNKEVSVEFAYQGDDDIDLDIEDGVGIENTGDARRVFATVIEIVKRYANKYKPNMITFSSDPEEPSRMRLYGALVKRADRLLPDYRDISGEIIGSRTHEYVLARKGYQVNEASGYIPSKKENIEEIGFADSLDSIKLPDSEIIANSKLSGTIGQKSVRVFNRGTNTLYFFSTDTDILALILLDGDHLKAIKNFTNEKGMIYSLLNYIVSFKETRIKISPSELFTSMGVEWLMRLAANTHGLRLTTTSGDKVDIKQIRHEWNNARLTKEPGPTGLIISEMSEEWKTNLLENESSLMPFVIFEFSDCLIEASGYIPSKKEANDPRFKTALTVDVKPDSIQKNAKAFGSKTSRAGIPPQARADGKIK